MCACTRAGCGKACGCGCGCGRDLLGTDFSLSQIPLRTGISQKGKWSSRHNLGYVSRCFCNSSHNGLRGCRDRNLICFRYHKAVPTISLSSSLFRPSAKKEQTTDNAAALRTKNGEFLLSKKLYQR